MSHLIILAIVWISIIFVTFCESQFVIEKLNFVTVFSISCSLNYLIIIEIDSVLRRPIRIFIQMFEMEIIY